MRAPSLFATWERLRRWASGHPASVAALLLLLGFGAYLYAEPVAGFYGDAAGYWWRASKYWAADGHFQLLGYDDVLRGYLFPLLLAPLLRLAGQHGWLPADVFRPLGAGLAALTFGVVGPCLCKAVAGTGRVGLGRRLLFGALGFAVWRGYFHYPLTDFPALLALAGSLWAVLRGRWPVLAGLLAGALLGAALNFRPVYLAALPLLGLLALWPPPAAPAEAAGAGRAWGRRLALLAGLLAGLALVLAPQALINRAHFGSSSPLVLAHLPGADNLYAQQLDWGLRYGKYETNVGGDYPSPRMFFLSPESQRLWEATGGPGERFALRYAALVRQAPLTVLRGWLLHLFNGLDVQYPTPYVRLVYVPTWGLAALNYTVLLAGLAVLAGRARRGWHWRPALVLLALLGACAAVLPVAIECRFLLPLHLLLSAAAAFGAQPRRWWRGLSAGRRGAALGLYAAAMVGLFALSISAQRHLEHGPRAVFVPAGLPWHHPQPEPW